MNKRTLESATLFTPGRASYLDEAGILQLSDASQRRAWVASRAYDRDFNDAAVYAGGFPGLAQGWDPSLTPPADRREATLMAGFLTDRLEAEGLTSEEIKGIVRTQGDSSNSFGDVIRSVERGLLDPNRFNTDMDHGVELIAGALHGKRFTMLLSKALYIDPARVQRVGMRDIYGTPEHPLQPAESRTTAVLKEMTAIGLTAYVLQGVKSGDLEAVKDAEQHFIEVYRKVVKPPSK